MASWYTSSRMRRAIWVSVLFAGSVGLFVKAQGRPAAQEPPPSVVVEDDIPYAKIGDRTLLLDLARPKQGDGPFPAVLCIHGGGWREGNKRDFRQAILSLAQQGYVAASVQYRFAPDSQYPSQIDDVKAAVRYLRSRAAELKIDPDRIGALGGSAGAHLALLLGTTDADDIKPVGEHADVSSAVQAVVSLAGPTDLTRPFPEASEAMVVALIGKPRADAPEAYERASPIRYVDAGDASTLLIHGTKDELVPYKQATSLLDAFKKAGVEAELFTIQDGGHGSGGNPEDWAAAIVKMAEFFDKTLKRGKGTASPASP